MLISLAQPPVPSARLQPSIHGRGVRPFVFNGTIDEWHAPGAFTKNNTTRCAVDAAWLVGRVLGAPVKAPPMWPGVPGARERAIEFGKRVGLYGYQQEGAAFLAERDYAVLADAPGNGKTCQSLIAAEARLSLAAVPSPTTPVVLILCPALAKRHWQREVLKWTGHKAAVLDSLTPDALPPNRYIIANYDILYGGRKKDAAGVVFDVDNLPGWGGVLARAGFLITIADEAHLLRGRTSRRTNTVRSVCKKIPVVWGLTGTPMPNYVRDLWALIDLLSAGLHGSYWTWAKVFCLDPSTPILQADGIYKPLGDLRVGDRVLGWQEDVPGKRRHFVAALVKSVSVRDVERFSITMASGRQLISSRDHNWFTGRSEKEFRYRPLYNGRKMLKKLLVAAPAPVDDPTGHHLYQLGYIRGLVDGDGWRRFQQRRKRRPGKSYGGRSWVVSAAGKDDEHMDRAFAFGTAIGLRPRMQKRSLRDGCRRLAFYGREVYRALSKPIERTGVMFKRGWLAGMYDAEGAAQNQICQKTDPIKCARIEAWLKEFGFTTHRTWHGTNFLGGRYELLRFWQVFRPALLYKLHRQLLNTINVVHHDDAILGWRNIGNGPVVSIETSTGNYIADGYMSKNCGAHQAQYGWNDTGSDHLEELGQRLGFFMIGRSQAQAGLELPEKRREIYPIDVTVSAPTVHEGHEAMSKSGFVAKALRATAKAKRSAVVAQAVEALQNKQKVVVFLYMREQCDAVAKAIKAAVDCPVACVHGDLSPDGRDAQATTFRETAAPAAFVATIDSVGLAISLVGADLVLFGDLVPEPHKLLQAEARCHRHGSTCRVLVRYLIGTGTLDEGVAEAVIEKLATIEKTLGSGIDSQEMQTVLGGRSDESVIEGLFERLKALKGSVEE